MVEQASDDSSRFEIGATMLLDGEPASVVVSRRVGGGRRAIKLDRPAARGAELSIRRDELAPLPADSYYVADLVGLEVIDADGAVVGAVVDVLPAPANDCLELDSGVLLPLVEECIREIDLDGGRVLLNPGFTE